MRKNMYIVVWQDMLTQIRNYKWFKTKTEGGESTGFWLLYWFLIFPTVMSIFEEKRKAVIYVSFVCGMVLSSLLGRTCPMRLPKIMYLCPMEAKERRQYLVISYVTKIILVTLLSCVVEAIPYTMGCVAWYEAVIAVFSIVMAAIGMNMAGGNRTFQSSDEKDIALKKRCSSYPLWLMGQQIYAMFYYVIMFLGREMVAGENMPWLTMVLYLILSVINLLLTLMLLTFFRRTTEVLMNYEMVYEVDRTRRSAS